MQTILDRHWKLASIFILTLGAFWIWVSIVPPGDSLSESITAPQEGFLAPDFEMSTLDGNIVKLSDLRGKAVLVNFWATWCPPCRSEMPAMERVYSDYSQDQLLILAINNTHQDRRDDIEAFVSEQGLTFPILLDISGETYGRYQVSSLPTSFFIDPNGIINEVVIGGPMAEALLRTRVDRLLD